MCRNQKRKNAQKAIEHVPITGMQMASLHPENLYFHCTFLTCLTAAPCPGLQVTATKYIVSLYYAHTICMYVVSTVKHDPENCTR